MSGDALERVTDFHTLLRAARRAARGKRQRPDAAAFLSDVEREVLALSRELREGTYQPGPFKCFEIYEPKRRLISAAPFRDRVVHHAIAEVLEPLLERHAVGASFACRRGLGPVASVARIRALARRFPYALRLDVRRFFFSIDHGVLLEALARPVRDGWLRGLIGRIVAHAPPGAEPGRGLPIGNLTSQHLANFYLAAVDHFVLRTLRLGYVRYMDDRAPRRRGKEAVMAA